MNTPSPDHSPQTTHNANDIGTAIAYSILMVIIIVYSHVIFNAQLREIEQLDQKSWQKIDMLATPDIQFRFLKFRTGETKLYIERDYQEFYSQSCNGRLSQMCKDLQNDSITPMSLNFYTLIDPVSTAYTQLKLNSITFTDSKGRTQIYPNRQYAPNAPEVIWQAKKDMAWFFLSSFIFYLIFGFLSSTHNIIHLMQNVTLHGYATRAVIALFTFNYLYFVLRYFVLLIT